MDGLTADEAALRRLVGLADACELLAAATAFPDAVLARGLAEGSLAADAVACLEDCGVATERAAAACAPLRALAGCAGESLRADLARAHSLMHLRQGEGVAVWPYESAFVHVAQGRPGVPALFRAPGTLAVEAAMREAGALPANSRVEPCDSVWNECGFLAFLLGSEAAARAAGDDDAAAQWSARCRAFACDHAFLWLPAFFDALAAEAARVNAAGCARACYGAVGALGRQVMGALEEHLAAAPDA